MKKPRFHVALSNDYKSISYTDKKSTFLSTVH